MKKFAAADAETEKYGSAAGDTIKTKAANKADGTGATATCTSSITYTIKEGATNTVVDKLKTAGIKLGDGGAYGTVKATQATKSGCPNNANFGCSASDASVADDNVASADTKAGALGVYQAIKNSGEIFVWGLTIKAAAADGTTADGDKKKDDSAATLAVGAALGLVAAAIA